MQRAKQRTILLRKETNNKRSSRIDRQTPNHHVTQRAKQRTMLLYKNPNTERWKTKLDFTHRCCSRENPIVRQNPCRSREYNKVAASAEAHMRGIIDVNCSIAGTQTVPPCPHAPISTD